MTTLSEEEIRALLLSPAGELVRETILDDLERLKGHGGAPALNVIKCYEQDDCFPFFPN